jgi:antibiotic biosynthesis monooxygenase (ABM) superfamily enzyme
MSAALTPLAWKLWLLRWLALYPTLLLLYALLQPWITDWPQAARILLISGLGTWTLSFVWMPRFTRWFQPWLRRADGGPTHG